MSNMVEDFVNYEFAGMSNRIKNAACSGNFASVIARSTAAITS